MRWEEHVAMRKTPRSCGWCGGWYYAQAASTRTHATPCGMLLKAAEAMGLSREQYAAYRGIVIARRDDPPPPGALPWPGSAAPVPTVGTVVPDSRTPNVVGRAPAPPPAEHECPELIGARSELHRTLRELDKARRKVSEVVRAVRESVFEAARELRVDPPRPHLHPAQPAGAGSPEVCIVHATDWQLGKVTPSYSSSVCEERVRTLARKAIALTQIQERDHPVRECRLYLTGDLVEGEGIFPTQAHLVDAGLYRQLVVHGVRILSNLILDLLGHFDRIHVVGVIGNHGSIRLASGAADPESNADRMLYKAVELMLNGLPENPTPLGKSGRLTWDIPDGPGERNWFAVDRVGDWGFLLAHGDQIRGGFAGFPFYGTAKKAWGWIDAIPEPWDYLLIGHWHTPSSLTVNYRQVRVGGSTESHNTYAQENMAAVGQPTQWVAFCHPTKGVTAEYWVHLEDRIPSLRRAEAWRRPA